MLGETYTPSLNSFQEAVSLRPSVGFCIVFLLDPKYEGLYVGSQRSLCKNATQGLSEIQMLVSRLTHVSCGRKQGERSFIFVDVLDS